MNKTYIKQIKDFIPNNNEEIVTKEKVLNLIKNLKDKILFRDATTHLTSSGFIVNKEFNKSLMIFHKLRNEWSWTGGHLDGIDDIIINAIKEAKEETGLKNVTPLTNVIDSLDILYVYPHIRQGKKVEEHFHIAAGVILVADEDEELIINKEETGGLKWISFDEITEVNFNTIDNNLYTKLINKLKNIECL